jgi:hypothetical protein
MNMHDIQRFQALNVINKGKKNLPVMYAASHAKIATPKRPKTVSDISTQS